MRAESEGIPPNMYLVLYQSMGASQCQPIVPVLFFLPPFIGSGLSNAQPVLPD